MVVYHGYSCISSSVFILHAYIITQNIHRFKSHYLSYPLFLYVHSLAFIPRINSWAFPLAGRVKYIFFFHAFFILPHLSHCQKWSAKDVSLIPSVHMAMIPRAKPAPSQADSFPTYTWGVVLLQSLQNIGFFFIICAGRFVKASFLLPPFCKVSFYMQNAKKISRRTPVFLQECAFCITVIGTLWWVATQIAIAR